MIRSGGNQNIAPGSDPLSADAKGGGVPSASARSLPSAYHSEAKSNGGAA